jgi:DNA-binding GntR family transcriptional regulator
MRVLDVGSPVAPYLQIVEAIREAICDGEYPPGHQLPSRHKLADHFAVSPMTVSGAMRILAAEGTVVTHQGRGVYVLRNPGMSARDLAAEIDELRGRVEQLEHNQRHRIQDAAVHHHNKP